MQHWFEQIMAIKNLEWCPCGGHRVIPRIYYPAGLLDKLFCFFERHHWLSNPNKYVPGYGHHHNGAWECAYCPIIKVRP